MNGCPDDPDEVDGRGGAGTDDPRDGDAHALDDVLDQLEGACGEPGGVRVGRLVESFGRRGYGALLLVPASLEMSPIGGVPGVPTVLALVVALFAVQIVAGRSHMWLPGFLSERSLPADKLARAVEKGRPWAARLDRWFHGRIDALTGPLAARVAAATCVLLACTVPPLEIVPFASSAPMSAVALFGVALLVHDGLVMLAAFSLTLASLGIVGALVL